MNKPPAFQFYANDFLVGTLNFSAEEVGAYLLLLINQWDNDFIKEDEIEHVARVPIDKLSKVLLKFKRSKKGLFNKRMEASKKNIKLFKEKKSKSGSKGAKKRWCNKLKDNDLNGSAIDLPLANDSSSSSSSYSLMLSKEKVYQLLRSNTNRNSITDRQIHEETAEFIEKYKDQKIGNLSALTNTWAGNIKPAKVKPMQM